MKLEFQPQVTVRKMFSEGIMGGAYFGPEAGPTMNTELYSMCLDELSGINTDLWVADKYLPKRNRYKVRSGLSFQQWTDYGWINERDPYGWIEWYMKYSRGMRGQDDERQIARWSAISGVNGRWRNRLYGMIHKKGTHVDDILISPRIRQTLLHWAYIANQKDYDLWKKSQLTNHN